MKGIEYKEEPDRGELSAGNNRFCQYEFLILTRGSGMV